MVEPEKTDDLIATPPPRRPSRRRFWLILTGILVLLNLVTLGMGHLQAKQLRRQMQAREEAHQAQVKALITREGKTLARAAQMVNPQLLTNRGQEMALAYFAGLLENPNIEFIALFDANGAMTATTNMRLKGQVSVPPGLADIVASEGGELGAEVQFFGPITRGDGALAGAVLIGMNFATDNATKTAASESD